MKRNLRYREFGNICGSDVGPLKNEETYWRFRSAWRQRHSEKAEMRALERQRDELHETANRYLAEKRNLKLQVEALSYALNGENGPCANLMRGNAALLAEAEQARAIIDDFAAKVDAGEYLVFKVDVKTPDTPKRSYLVAPLKRLLWVFPLALFVGFLIGAAIVVYSELVAL